MPEQSRNQSDYLAKILGGYQWTEANDGWAQAKGTLTSLNGLTRDVEQLRKENAELRAEVERLSNGRHTINIAGTSPDSAHTVTVPCVRMAEVKQRRAQLESARIELGRVADQIVALRTGLQDALAAIDWMFAAQQPLRDPWFAQRDALIARARAALGNAKDG